MDLKDTRHCIADTLRRTSRSLTQRYESHLRDVDLSIGQFSILSTVAQLQRREPVGLPISELAERLHLDRTTLTRNLAPLKRRRLVSDVEGADRRTRLVIITARGRRLLTRALPLWQRAQEETLDDIGRTRWRKLQQELLELADL